MTAIPKKVSDLTVAGGPFSKTYKIQWDAPEEPAGRPTTGYRLKVNQAGVKRLILLKNLPSEQTAYRLKRKFLLQNTVKRRGDIAATQYKYRVRVQAVNELGASVRAREVIRASVVR